MADISDAMWLAQNIGKLRLVVAAYEGGGVIVTPTPTPPSTGELDPGVPGATTLAFPSGRASGTNPVVLASSTLDSAPGDLLQVRYGSTSSLDAIAWVDATISTGDEDNEEREFTIDGTLPAGLTYFQARPKRVQDKGGNTIAARYGNPSNVISDTLQASGTATPTPTPPASGSTTIAPPTSGDNDVSTFGFTTTSVTAAEGNSGTTTFTFNVARAGGTTYPATVAWAVTGSGSNPAAASDFVGGAYPSGTLSYAANATTAAIVVNVAGDTAVETDETFTVTLTNPQTAGVISTATATGTITNDDAAAASTAFDPAATTSQVQLSDNNRRAQGIGSAGDQFAYGDVARGIGKKITFSFIAGSSPPNNLGIVFNTGQGTGTQVFFFDSKGLAMSGAPTYVGGDSMEFEMVANATTPTNIDMLVRKNGGTAQRYPTNSSAPLFYGAYFNAETTIVAITDFSNWK